MSEIWNQREDVKRELRLIRESMERMANLTESMLKMQRVIAKNTKEADAGVPEEET